MTDLEQLLIDLQILHGDPDSPLHKRITDVLSNGWGARPSLSDANLSRRVAIRERDILFGPFENWKSDPDQYRNLLNDFEQTHEDIQEHEIEGGRAITGVKKASVPNGVLQTCPRRLEDGRGPGSPFKGSEKSDVWGKDRTCSYCGSMHPDDFMAGAEDGRYELGPTDKSYKVYVTGDGLGHAKFYFQHLSEDQRRRFIELLNAKTLRIGMPGHFYSLPFFCKSVPKEALA